MTLASNPQRATHEIYQTTHQAAEYCIISKGKLMVRPSVMYAVQNLPPVPAKRVLALEYPTLSKAEIQSLHDHCRVNPWGVADDPARPKTPG